VDPKKKAKLEEAGYRVGTVADFLGLTKDEQEEIEGRLAALRKAEQESDGQS
jgi:hypothetical protein